MAAIKTALLEVMKEAGSEVKVRIEASIDHWDWGHVHSKDVAEKRIDAMKDDVLNHFVAILDEKSKQIREAVLSNIEIKYNPNEGEAEMEIKIEPAGVAQPASESDSVEFVSERQMTPIGKRRASGSGGRARKGKLTHAFTLTPIPKPITNRMLNCFLARRRASRFVLADSSDDDEFQEEDAETAVSVEQGPRRTSGRVKATTNYDEVDYFEKRGIH
ncbi:hypothetical protein F4774DRAFT_274426 [Daldinia eschscholtzii]|nr:hypothetical protein F4774DRAFT_274426 [Daldinia eschscholtzii]